jgi:hypothetical protein
MGPFAVGPSQTGKLPFLYVQRNRWDNVGQRVGHKRPDVGHLVGQVESCGTDRWDNFGEVGQVGREWDKDAERERKRAQRAKKKAAEAEANGKVAGDSSDVYVPSAERPKLTPAEEEAVLRAGRSLSAQLDIEKVVGPAIPVPAAALAGLVPGSKIEVPFRAQVFVGRRHPTPVSECVKRARAGAFRAGPCNPDGSFRTPEQRARIDRETADRAEAYCRWRVSAYESGECPVPW